MERTLPRRGDSQERDINYEDFEEDSFLDEIFEED